MRGQKQNTWQLGVTSVQCSNLLVHMMSLMALLLLRGKGNKTHRRWGHALLQWQSSSYHRADPRWYTGSKVRRVQRVVLGDWETRRFPVECSAKNTALRRWT